MEKITSKFVRIGNAVVDITKVVGFTYSEQWAKDSLLLHFNMVNRVIITSVCPVSTTADEASSMSQSEVDAAFDTVVALLNNTQEPATLPDLQDENWKLENNRSVLRTLEIREQPKRTWD